MAGRIGPETRIPGEALEVRDVELPARLQREDAKAEQARLGLEDDPVLLIRHVQRVGAARQMGQEPARTVERQRSDELLLAIHVEEAGVVLQHHDFVPVPYAVLRSLPGAGAGDEATRHGLGAEVDGEPGNRADRREPERGGADPHSAPHFCNSASNLGSDAASAASASSKSHRSRSGSSISFETARTSTAGTPASS